MCGVVNYNMIVEFAGCLSLIGQTSKQRGENNINFNLLFGPSS